MTLMEQSLVDVLKKVLQRVESIPEHDRFRLGLYSMPEFNEAYEIIQALEKQR